MPPAVRTKNLARLKKAGFGKVTSSLPTKRGTSKLRPLAEIAGRLVALNVLYAWVAAPADAIPTKRLKAALEKGKARRWLTAEERAVVAMPRPKAHAAHVDTIGWRLENMWPLAWVLGFPAEPPFDGAMIEGETSRAIVVEFLEGGGLTAAELLAKHEARDAAEVVAGWRTSSTARTTRAAARSSGARRCRRASTPSPAPASSTNAATPSRGASRPARPGTTPT